MISERNSFPIILTILTMQFIWFSNVALSQSNVEEIDAPFIYYSAKPLGNLTFINNRLKMHSYEKQLVLLDEHNLPLDTFQIEDARGYNNIHSILRVDSNTVSLATNQLSYLFSIKGDSINVVKRYTRKQIRKIAGAHHYAIQLHQGMITFFSKSSFNKRTQFFSLVNEKNELVKKFTFKELDTDYYTADYLYPHQLSFFEDKVGLNLKGSNEFIFIDLDSRSLKRIPLPRLYDTIKAQSVTFDYLSKTFYLMKIEERDFVKIYHWDFTSNDFRLINTASLAVNRIRCGIVDKKMFFIGDFDNQRAWYRVPLNKLHEL